MLVRTVSFECNIQKEDISRYYYRVHFNHIFMERVETFLHHIWGLKSSTPALGPLEFVALVGNNWKHRVLWFHLYDLWTNSTIQTIFTSTLLNVVSDMSYCYIVCKSFRSALQQLSPERLYMFTTHNPASVTVNRGQVSLFCHSSIPLNTRITVEWYLFMSTTQ